MAEAAPWETPQPQQQQETPPWGRPPQAAAAAPGEGGLLQAPFELFKTIPQFIGALETPEGRSRLLGATYEATLKPILEHKPIFEGMTPEEETEAGVFGATMLLGGPRAFMRTPAEAAAVRAQLTAVRDAIENAVTKPSAERLETFARTGSPDGVPIEPPLPETKPSPIQPIQGSPNPDMRRLAAAQTGIPEVDAILNHPTIQSVIENPVVDRSHTIPYEAGGSEPTNRPTTYLDKHVPQTFTVSSLSDPAKKITFDTAEPTIIHENAEEMAMNILMRPSVAGSNVELFQTISGGTKATVDLPDVKGSFRFDLSRVGEKDYGIDLLVHDLGGKTGKGIEAYRALADNLAQQGKKLYVAKTELVPSTSKIFQRLDAAGLLQRDENGTFLKPMSMSPEEAYRVAHFNVAEVAEHAWYRAHDIDPEAAEAEWKKIQPGIQHEIASDTPPDLYHKEYPGADVTKARHEDVFETGPTPEETARGFEILRNAPELQSISAPKLLNVANDLGVIGAPRRIDEGTPQQAAQRAVAAAGPPGEKITMEPNAARDKAGNIRLDQIGINADAKDTLLEAAKANDDFSQARQGNIPLTQIMSLSDATGIPLATLRENEAGLGRLMHNDAVVRTWLQAFHQATDEIAAQMKKAKLSGADADFETLRDMKLRLTHMQEQVSGLTAEAGRTLGVFREFYERKGKAEAISELMRDNPGNDLDSLKKLADLGSSLNPRTQLPRWLNNIREPGFWDKYLYYWVNALLSGPITHALYVGANFGMAAYDAGPVTLAAGIYGTLRRAVTGNTEGMYPGEAPARLFGLLTGTPQALKAAAIAARDNIQVPLPGEVAKNYNPIINLRPNPIGGKLGVVVGAPMRGATGIHSFFNFLGYRSSIEAQAYRMAAQEHVALRPGEDFLNRWRFHAANPNPDMMAKGIEDGYRLTFIEEQGEIGKKVSQLANVRVKFPSTDAEFQPFKLIMPFTHIPGNIMKQGIEQSPLGPILDHETRSDLLGRNGMAAHDMAMGRLVMGGAITGMVVNWALNDAITGYGPTEPTERALWLRTHQPYSIKLGGYWVSYNKFGPIGDFVGVVANLSEIAPKLADKQYADAAGQLLKASSHLVMDEVGMQGVANIIEAMDNEHKAGTYIAKTAASNIPFSSLLRQTASVTDPYTREAKTFVDNMRYTIPYARQDLLPRRDWLGQPVPNPGYATIVRRAPVNTDPLDYEMQRLQIKPGVPEDRIGGVKLSPEMYDLYQEKAGLMTKMMLNAYVNSPGWNQLPDYNRETIIRKTIESARKDAGQALQMANPLLILQGIKQQQDYLSGLTHTKRPKEAPVLDQTLQPPTLGIRG